MRTHSALEPHLPLPSPADDEPLEWRPALALAAASAERHPLPTTRFCVDERGGAAPATAAAAGRFLVGSLEGELAAVDATSFSQERKASD